MPLSIIGAGLGCTGTMSLKVALEELGFGPCYGSEHALAHPADHRFWERALYAQQVEWDEVFDRYRSIVGQPACLFFRKFAEKYPLSKFILTIREPNAWFESIQVALSPLHIAAYKEFRSWSMLGKSLIACFGDRFNNRDAIIAAYERHNAEVRRFIPADRLLVYEVKQGWEPLCKFLDTPIPDKAFPRAKSIAGIRQDPLLIRAILTELHAGRHERVRALMEQPI